jgi:hypothetical protein
MFFWLDFLDENFEPALQIVRTLSSIVIPLESLKPLHFAAVPAANILAIIPGGYHSKKIIIISKKDDLSFTPAYALKPRCVSYTIRTHLEMK